MKYLYETVKRLTIPLAIAGSILTGCGEHDVVRNKNIPVPPAMIIESTDCKNHVYGIDIDGNGTIDEAVSMQGIYPGMQGLYQIIPLLKDSGSNWNHFVASDVAPADQQIASDRVEVMPDSMRNDLTRAYNLLQGTY